MTKNTRGDPASGRPGRGGQPGQRGDPGPQPREPGLDGRPLAPGVGDRPGPVRVHGRGVRRRPGRAAVHRPGHPRGRGQPADPRPVAAAGRPAGDGDGGPHAR